MGVEVHASLRGGVGARHTGSTPGAGQEQRLNSDQPSAGLLVGPGLQCVLCLGAHGNAGTWVILSPLTTPAPAQEAEPAVIHPREPDAGPDPEGCPVPEAVPPPAAAPAAAVEPGPAWAASPDLAEGPPALAEGPSPGPALAPAAEEELPQDHPAGPAPEPLAEGAQPDESEGFALPSLIDLLLLFSFILMLLFSQRDLVYNFLTLNMWAFWVCLAFIISYFFLVLASIFPLQIHVN